MLKSRLMVFYKQNLRNNNFPVVCEHWPTLQHAESSCPLLSTAVSAQNCRRLKEVKLQRSDHNTAKGVTSSQLKPFTLSLSDAIADFIVFVFLLTYA